MPPSPEPPPSIPPDLIARVREHDRLTAALEVRLADLEHRFTRLQLDLRDLRCDFASVRMAVMHLGEEIDEQQSRLAKETAKGGGPKR